MNRSPPPAMKPAAQYAEEGSASMVPMETWWSVAVCAALVIGVVLHRYVKVHVPIMLSAFAADLALVLYLELGRSAVERAIEGVSLLRYFHISMAVLSIILYIVLIRSGWRLLWTGQGREFHKRTAIVFGAARGLVLATSFAM